MSTIQINRKPWQKKTGLKIEKIKKNAEKMASVTIRRCHCPRVAKTHTTINTPATNKETELADDDYFKIHNSWGEI